MSNLYPDILCTYYIKIGEERAWRLRTDPSGLGMLTLKGQTSSSALLFGAATPYTSFNIGIPQLQDSNTVHAAKTHHNTLLTIHIN